MPEDKITLITFYPDKVWIQYYHVMAWKEEGCEHICRCSSKSWAREIAEHLSHVYDVEFKETT